MQFSMDYSMIIVSEKWTFEKEIPVMQIELETFYKIGEQFVSIIAEENEKVHLNLNEEL